MCSLVIGLVIGLALTAPAGAAEITAPPVVSGEHDPLGVFSRLAATPGTWSPAAAQPAYAWLRCDSLGESCAPIDGACSRNYTTSETDVGNTLRIRLTVVAADGSRASASSVPTGVVESRVYDLPTEPVLDTCTKVTPTGPQAGEFESGTRPAPQPDPIRAGPDDELTRFIRPFPVVRIAGRFTRLATTITLVSVRAPRGVRIAVGCRGPGCAYRRRVTTARVRRVRTLQRRYRPGAVLVLRITQSDRIGKYVRLRIRSGKAPLRTDRCVMPGKERPVKCPAA